MGLTRRAFLRRSLGASLAAGIIYPTLVEPWRVVIEKISVALPNLPPEFAGFRIVQLSDLHFRPYTTLRQIAHVVELANGLAPDLTVITGDFITQGSAGIDELAPLLGTLRARHGITGILGNHDQASGSAPRDGYSPQSRHPNAAQPGPGPHSGRSGDLPRGRRIDLRTARRLSRSKRRSRSA